MFDNGYYYRIGRLGDLEWPYEIHAKIVRMPMSDDLAALLEKAKKIHDIALKLSAKNTELETRIAELEKENRFLIREIR